MAAEKTDLDNELFKIQCRILDLGTDDRLTAAQLRAKLMFLREEIIQRRAEIRELEDAN